MLLASVGILPTGSSLRAALRPGQRSVAYLVDRYGIAPGPVRDLLIRYLEERKTGADYTTLKSLARMLAGNFWTDLERHHPELGSTDTLALPKEVVTAWKERLSVIVSPDGSTRPRADYGDVVMTVRSFYLDIRDWALHDASLAPWVIASPITRADVAGNAKRKLLNQARIHQRIRERVPLVPQMLARLEQERRDAEQMLALAKQTTIGDTFSFAELTYRRTATRVRAGRGLPPELACDVVCLETDKHLSVGRVEEDAFWTWAVIETLRHTGLRIEELLERTHLALISHRLSTTGELVPLLQIVPSKTNEERLLLVTPELASVLASVISRLRNPLQRVGAARGPLRQLRGHHRPAAAALVPTRVRHRPGGHVSHYGARRTPRRVPTNGVDRPRREPSAPDTTRLPSGLHHHRCPGRAAAAHRLEDPRPPAPEQHPALHRGLPRRSHPHPPRLRRPTPLDPATRGVPRTHPQEWDEFEEHFTLRRVELGSSARPYGSTCEHEHACIRCPVLRVDPQQLHRLHAIAENLAERITEAGERGWAGEVQQLTISLQAARDKIAATAPPRDVLLGLPTRPRRYHGARKFV